MTHTSLRMVKSSVLKENQVTLRSRGLHPAVVWSFAQFVRLDLHRLGQRAEDCLPFFGGVGVPHPALIPRSH